MSSSVFGSKRPHPDPIADSGSESVSIKKHAPSPSPSPSPLPAPPSDSKQKSPSFRQSTASTLQSYLPQCITEIIVVQYLADQWEGWKPMPRHAALSQLKFTCTDCTSTEVLQHSYFLISQNRCERSILHSKLSVEVDDDRVARDVQRTSWQDTLESVDEYITPVVNTTRIKLMSMRQMDEKAETSQIWSCRHTPLIGGAGSTYEFLTDHVDAHHAYQRSLDDVPVSAHDCGCFTHRSIAALFRVISNSWTSYRTLPKFRRKKDTTGAPTSVISSAQIEVRNDQEWIKMTSRKCKLQLRREKEEEEEEEEHEKEKETEQEEEDELDKEQVVDIRNTYLLSRRSSIQLEFI